MLVLTTQLGVFGQFCGYGDIDLSALTTQGPFYSAQDEAGYSYVFNVCGVMDVDRTCAASEGMICQYVQGAYVSTVARWVGSGSAKWSYVNPLNITEGVQAVFDNGDACGTQNHRKATVKFVCDPSKFVGTCTIESDDCTYTLTVPTKFACTKEHLSCDYHQYNVSGVQKFDAQKIEVEQYTYVARPCATISNDSKSMVDQFWGGEKVATIALWSSESPPVWSYTNPHNFSQGVTATFNNGERCIISGNPRELRMNFVCSAEEEEVLSIAEDVSNACAYSLNVTTKYACLGQSTCGYGGIDVGRLQSNDGYVAKGDTGYSYGFNVCDVFAIDPNCARKNGMICEYESNKLVATIARWTNNSSDGVWSYVNASDPTQGIQALYDNGDVCANTGKPRKATVQYVCDPSHKVGLPVAQEYQECMYLLKVPTMYACLQSKFDSLLSVFKKNI